MWILLSFDVPAENKREYRRLRTELLRNGFTFFQKSLCLRYAANSGRAETLLGNLSRLAPPGRMMFLRISDHDLQSACFWQDGKKELGPAPPEPWCVI